MNLRRYLVTALTTAMVFPALGFLSVGQAHNNPTFREDLLISIDVGSGENGVFSQPFSLEWEKKTVQLIWRIEPQQADVKFAIARDAELVLENVTHDQATARLKGENYTVVNVEGAQSPFVIKVFAKVLDRSKPKKN